MFISTILEILADMMTNCIYPAIVIYSLLDIPALYFDDFPNESNLHIFVGGFPPAQHVWFLERSFTGFERIIENQTWSIDGLVSNLWSGKSSTNGHKTKIAMEHHLD